MEVGTHKLLASVGGVLEGPIQTVTRAELTAFVQAIRFTPSGPNIAVVSDSAYVVNEFAKLQHGQMPMKHRDLWARVKRHVLNDKRRIRCVKVKAHTTEDDLAEGKYGITVFTREGNKLADTAADDAAKLAAICPVTIREIRSQDAAGYVVMRRLVAINMHCVRLEVCKRQQVVESGIALRDRRLGTALHAEYLKATTHQVVALSDGWKCTVCRSFTARANLQQWCTTPCRKVISDTRGTRFGRGVVHYTHNIRHTRGVLWCKSCGFFSVKRCEGLAKKCLCVGLVRHPTPAGHEFIRRMGSGIPPQGYKAWPDLNPAVVVWYRTWLGRNPDRSPIWCGGDVRPPGYVVGSGMT